MEKQRSFALPAYVTKPMQFLSKVSTPLATQYALRLFFQPIAFPIPEREKPMLKISRQEILKTEAREAFTLHHLGAPHKPKLLFVHGWSGRGTQFFKIAEKLQNDFCLIALDAPAHGQHKGARTSMLSFIQAIEKTATQHGPIYGAIGHSLGGMALFNALDRSLVLKKLVIMGSPNTVPNVIHDFAQQVKASPSVEQKLISTIEKKFNLKVEDLSIEHLAQKHNPEGLIFHDEQDADVPVFNAKQAAAAWPKAKLHLSNGLGHRRILMDWKTISTLYDFFKN